MPRPPACSWPVAIWRALRSVPFLLLVLAERARQERKWGPQRHPSFGRDGPLTEDTVEQAKRLCEADFASADGNWCVIFNEEAFEAMSARDVPHLLAEQTQAAAVLAAWWECAKRPGHQFGGPSAS